MPKPGFRVALVVQQDVVEILLVLPEGVGQWVRCVGCIESIPNRSGQERFLTPSKNQVRQTRHHDHLSTSFHAGPAWIPCSLLYLNTPGYRHGDWLHDVAANLDLNVLMGLHAHDCSCENFVARHRSYSSVSITLDLFFMRELSELGGILWDIAKLAYMIREVT